jgi:hypothetical protein
MPSSAIDIRHANSNSNVEFYQIEDGFGWGMRTISDMYIYICYWIIVDIDSPVQGLADIIEKAPDR